MALDGADRRDRPAVCLRDAHTDAARPVAAGGVRAVWAPALLADTVGAVLELPVGCDGKTATVTATATATGRRRKFTSPDVIGLRQAAMGNT